MSERLGLQHFILGFVSIVEFIPGFGQTSMGQSEVAIDSYRLFKCFSSLKECPISQCVSALVIHSLRARLRYIRARPQPADNSPGQQGDGQNGQNEYAHIWTRPPEWFYERRQGTRRTSAMPCQRLC